jgi:hypothetical protein
VPRKLTPRRATELVFNPSFSDPALRPFLGCIAGFANRALASSGFLGLAQYRAEHSNVGKAVFHSAERLFHGAMRQPADTDDASWLAF